MEVHRTIVVYTSNNNPVQVNLLHCVPQMDPIIKTTFFCATHHVQRYLERINASHTHVPGNYLSKV